MQITNTYNLPDPIVKAVSSNYPPKTDRLSVSDLIGPPLIRYLKIKHWDELKEDASDRIWALLGSAVHYILHKARSENVLAEEYLRALFNGVTIVGRPDLLDNPGVLSDYKITSVYSFLLGDKTEWEQQLNIYRWLYEKHGFTITKLQIVAILRDWQKSKSEVDADYPDIPVIVKEIPMWSMAATEKFMTDKIDVLTLAKDPIDMICTAKERWRRPDTWAVMQKNKKRALRVFDTQEAADKYRYDNRNSSLLSVEERKGKDIRCESYCPVRDFCQWKTNTI